MVATLSPGLTDAWPVVPAPQPVRPVGDREMLGFGGDVTSLDAKATVDLTFAGKLRRTGPAPLSRTVSFWG